MSDADEAIDDARDVGAETVSELWEEGHGWGAAPR